MTTTLIADDRTATQDVLLGFGAGADGTYHHKLRFRSRRAGEIRGEIEIEFRAIGPQDEALLRSFFASHTEDTIYLRYGMMVREMTHERALQLIQLDGHNDFALIGIVAGPAGPFMVAIGRYLADPETGLAEVAFVVHEDYRGLGIATHLLRFLSTVIRANGFLGMTAQVLEINTPMLASMKEALGTPTEASSACGERTMTWRFGAPGSCN